MNKRYFSSGGGVQSIACLVLSAQGKIDYPVHIFSNVGNKAENPGTIAYVERYAKPYAAKHGIEFVEICKRDKHGNSIDLYDALMKDSKSIDIPVRMKNGAPGNRSCTQDYKIIPVSNYIFKELIATHPEYIPEIKRVRKEVRARIKDLHSSIDDSSSVASLEGLIVESSLKSTISKQVLKAETLKAVSELLKPVAAVLGLGISVDEISRAKTSSGFAHYSTEHPLIDLWLDRSNCAEIILSAGLPLPPKSSCYFCPFTQLTRWVELKRNDPAQFEKACQLEDMLNDRRAKLGKDRIYFAERGARKGLSLRELVPDQMGLDLWGDNELHSCESGYCMV